MALYRQGIGLAPFGSPSRASDHENADQKLPVVGRHGNNSRYGESSNRTPMKSSRGKRSTRTGRCRSYGIGMIIFLLLCVVIVTILGGDYLFSFGRHRKGHPGLFRSHDFFDEQDHSIFFSLWKIGTRNNQSLKDNANYPCEIDFRETTHGLSEPEFQSRFANFSLEYIEEEDSAGATAWEPRFAGHQSLEQRERTFVAKNQSIHCGFVNETGASKSTGFDMAEEDVQFLRTCKIAVSSCIFGSSDNVRSPRGKKLTGSYKKDVCFVMFVDQRTLDVIKQEGQGLDDKGYLGLWKVIIVKNMPYTDARRIGKIPKLLTHRLFPAARYSIWLDSKLRLQSDPVLILEYFLWRGGHEYAISNHYDRHCVWEEVQQNKKLNKYNHSVIDEQFSFYKADGLIRFNASDPKKLLPSYVPEGSFIIRAHTPMSNLFSCLWFNEVDRFTPRDQLSFAYTYMKLVRTNPNEHFYLNMFKDCERKTIAKLFRHRKNSSSIT